MEAVEEQEKKEMDSERKVTDFSQIFRLPIFLQVTLTEVLVTEVTEEGKFYACNVSDGPALETLMEGLRFDPEFCFLSLFSSPFFTW